MNQKLRRSASKSLPELTAVNKAREQIALQAVADQQVVVDKIKTVLDALEKEEQAFLFHLNHCDEKYCSAIRSAEVKASALQNLLRRVTEASAQLQMIKARKEESIEQYNIAVNELEIRQHKAQRANLRAKATGNMQNDLRRQLRNKRSSD